MISLSDAQLETVMAAAATLPMEKRAAYLERVAAVLRIRLGMYSDADVSKAAQAALRGLVQGSAA